MATQVLYEMESTFEAIVDCNGNGVPDDLSPTSSADINGNAIPDDGVLPRAYPHVQGVVAAPTGGVASARASHAQVVLTPTSTHTTHQTSPAAT